MLEIAMVNQILNAVGINGGVLAALNAAFNPHTGMMGYRSMINVCKPAESKSSLLPIEELRLQLSKRRIPEEPG